MAATWSAFIGERGHRAVLDTAGIPWTQARNALLTHARQALDDNTGGCPHCQSQSAQAVEDLTALTDGTPWEGSIDWDDYELSEDR
jgi:hypothetical protein